MIVQRLLGVWIALAIVAGGTAVAVEALDLAADEANVDATPSTTATTADPSLRPDQVRVTGTITALHVEGARLEPLALPLTIDAPERGSGNGAEVRGILVDGKPATVVWDAGRPLQLKSGAALVLDPVTIDLAPTGLVLSLGGAVHGFAPGTYRIDTPVALGQSGLARPRDTVTFDADERSTMEVKGSPAILLPRVIALILRGPGRVTLTGDLRAITADGNRAVHAIELPSGPFEIELTPGPAGYTVEALLEGATTLA